MLPIFLVLISACMAIVLKLHPLVIISSQSKRTVDTIFGTFLIELQNLLVVAALLDHALYNFGPHYTQLKEPRSRMARLCNFAKYTELHDTIFSLPKLSRNKEMAAVLLDSNDYHGNALNAHPFARDYYYHNMMASRIIVRLSKDRLYQMESITPIEYFVRNSSYKGFVWAFETLKKAMTPRIMAVFISRTVNEIRTLNRDIYEEEDRTIPILQYLDVENEVERVMRAVLIIQASERQLPIKGCPHYSQLPARAAWAVLTDLCYINGRRMAANPQFYEMMFLRLVTIEGLQGLTYWETLGTVLMEHLQSRSTKRIENIQRFFAICPFHAMSPLTWRELLERTNQIPGFTSEYVSLVPENYLPNVLRTVSERLNIFIREGPLFMLSDNIRPWSVTWFPRGFLKLCETGRLPLNLKFLDGEVEINFSYLIIEKMKETLQRLVPNRVDSYQIALISTALVYLLVSRTKADLQILFSSRLDAQTPWEKCFNRLNRKTSGRIAKMLQDWKLATLFMPIEMRRLVDSSFKIK